MKTLVLNPRYISKGDIDFTPLTQEGAILLDPKSPEELEKALQETEILLFEHQRIDEALLEAAPKLRLLVTLSTGYDHIDLAACQARGIRVAHVPSYGTEAVAQYTIALMLEACHRVGAHAERVKRGEWNRDSLLIWENPQILLDQKTLAIVGYGRIGQRVGEVAEALGMKVIGKNREPLEELLPQADVLSLHCNLTRENHHMLREENLMQMKKGSILVNTARGKLVEPEGLYKALTRGPLAFAALDVFDEEPIPSDHPLLRFDHFLLTPHMAWGAREARQKIIESAAQTLKEVREGKPITHEIS